MKDSISVFYSDIRYLSDFDKQLLFIGLKRIRAVTAWDQVTFAVYPKKFTKMQYSAFKGLLKRFFKHKHAQIILLELANLNGGKIFHNYSKKNNMRAHGRKSN